MSFQRTIIVALILGTPLAVSGERLITEWGGHQPTSDYFINSNAGTIEIYAPGVYKFHSLNGNAVDDIVSIALGASDPTSGTVTILIERGPGSCDPAPCSTAGAHHLKKVEITRPGVTGVISGIQITGNFLELGAMTIDQVTGDIIVGSGTGDLLNDMTINAALSNQVAIAGNAEGKITVDGDLYDNITVGGRMDSSVGSPGIIIGGGLGAGGKIQVKQASTATDNEILIALAIGDPGVTYAISATTPREWQTGQDWAGFVGGDPADTGFEFDITLEAGVSETEPKAAIVLDNTSLPQGETYDIRLFSPSWAHFDLSRIEEKSGTNDPQVHNITVEGDVDLGDFTTAIDLPHATVNSIFVEGTLGDEIHVDKIGLLSFGSLGSGSCVPDCLLSAGNNGTLSNGGGQGPFTLTDDDATFEDDDVVDGLRYGRQTVQIIGGGGTTNPGSYFVAQGEEAVTQTVITLKEDAGASSDDVQYEIYAIGDDACDDLGAGGTTTSIITANEYGGANEALLNPPSGRRFSTVQALAKAGSPGSW